MGSLPNTSPVEDGRDKTAEHTKPLRSTLCDHSYGVLIGREGQGRCRAQCLACGMVGLPRGDFPSALRTLEERALEE